MWQPPRPAQRRPGRDRNPRDWKLSTGLEVIQGGSVYTGFTWHCHQNAPGSAPDQSSIHYISMHHRIERVQQGQLNKLTPSRNEYRSMHLRISKAISGVEHAPQAYPRLVCGHRDIYPTAKLGAEGDWGTGHGRERKFEFSEMPCSILMHSLCTARSRRTIELLASRTERVFRHALTSESRRGVDTALGLPWLFRCLCFSSAVLVIIQLVKGW